MSTILITGGAGQLGSALATKLAYSNHLVVIIDNLSTGKLLYVPQVDNVIFVKGDVNVYRDLAAIFGRFDFDYVFHYAAVVGVKRTLDHPIAVLEDIEGIKNILSLSKNSKVKRVFYSSSSEVYGEPLEFPQNESTTPLNSRLPYAIVKNAGESYMRSYHQEFGLDYTIFRFFNTYGPYQSDDFVIPKFIKAALHGAPITIYGDGLQTRSFCYIDDNVDTCVEVMQANFCINDVLNVGNDTEISILDLAKKIISLSESTSEILECPALKEGDMKRRCPDNTKMKRVLQRPLIDLDTGLLRVIDAFRRSGDFDSSSGVFKIA